MARAFVIPSSPEDRKKVKDAMVEISASKDRQGGERDFQKETLKKLEEETGIPKKELAQLAKWYHNTQNDLKKVKEAFSDSEDLIDAIFPEASEESGDE